MRDPLGQRTLDDIGAHGWSGKVIPADDVGPGFEYTVGLMGALDHPEVIVFRLPRDVGHEVLWTIVKAIGSGQRFDSPGRYGHVLEGVECACCAVHRSHLKDYFGYALWHRSHLGKRGTLRAVQCVWPERSGVFPGEDGCDAAVEALQPDLSRPKRGSARSGGWQSVAQPAA